MTCGIEYPERTTLIRDEDPFGRIDRCSDGTNHAARDLGRGLPVGADAPDDAVRTVGHDDVTARREEIARGIFAREHRTDAIDAVASRPVRKRAPLAERVGLWVDRHNAVASLLSDQDAPIRLHDHPFRRRHPAGDSRDRAVGIQRRHGSGRDVAEEKPPLVVEDKVIRRGQFLQQHLRTG